MDDAGRLLAATMHRIGCVQPIEVFGGPSLRERLLPGLSGGGVVGALAHVEREGVRAVVCAGGWRLDGVQPRVVNGPVADVFVVRAEDATFVVERGMAGVQIGERIETAGLCEAAIGELRLSECIVPREHRLGGIETLEWIRRGQRGCLLAPWVGLLGELVSQCEVVARERGASQTRRATLADLRIRHALCERVVARATWRLEVGGALLDHDLAVASALLGDAVVSMTRAAMRDFGEPLGAGGVIERLARDASTLARLIEDREAPRRTIAAAMLGFG